MWSKTTYIFLIKNHNITPPNKKDSSAIALEEVVIPPSEKSHLNVSFLINVCPHFMFGLLESILLVSEDYYHHADV